MVCDKFDYFVMRLKGDQHRFGGGDTSTDLSATPWQTGKSRLTCKPDNRLN